MSETYGIIRLAKTKSAAVHAAQYHNDRLPGEHSNPDIKPHLHELNQEFLVHGKYEDEIAERTKDLKRKVRKDAVVLVDGMMTASPEWFQEHSYAEAMAFFRDGLDFIQSTFGKENVFLLHDPSRRDNLPRALRLHSDQGRKSVMEEVFSEPSGVD